MQQLLKNLQLLSASLPQAQRKAAEYILSHYQDVPFLSVTELAARIGRMNMVGFSRTGLVGNYVSREQPSVIDNPSIKNGFYDAPTVFCIFCQERF